MKKLNKILAIILAIHLVIGGLGPVLSVYAEAPEASEASEVEEIEEDAPDTEVDRNPDDPIVTPTPDIAADTTAVPTPTPTPDGSGNVGDTYITTGDGTTDGTIQNNANSNLSGRESSCCGGGGSVTNTGNGANSDNNGSASIVNDNTNDQTNSANINNGLTGASVTGTNTASNNVGDSYITTGNANATGTIITSANTNVDGIAISEFDIVDDHIGDFVLDFGANCISGCDGFTNTVQNLNNGSNSDNNANLDTTNNNTTNQTNDANVNNDLNLTANSGNNTTSGNTNGDSYITTGDASVAGNVLNFLNNNIAGNVIFGVVNIFGNLIGDIILPDSAINSFACATCGGNTSLVNSGNGTNSDNNASSDQTTNNTYNQINNADINNNLILDAGTGGNSASGNTGGDSYVTTGNANVMAQVLNIANTNLLGGDMWLVIVNKAGKWIGQIMGAPAGSMFAGSDGSEFSVDGNGQITVANAGNGAGSTNNAAADQTNNNTANQTNNTTLNNNINLNANTGKNSANDNTGGDSYVTTGDAQVIASLVNFVNNNIVGGRLLVTFVNVFGNWTGNLITPGQEKINTEQLAQEPLDSNTHTNPLAQGNTGPIAKLISTNEETNNIVASIGTFGSSGNTSGQGNSGNNNSQEVSGNTVTVAGINNISDALSGLTKGIYTKQKVKINLAWILLLTPVLALMIIARKLYLKVKLPKAL